MKKTLSIALVLLFTMTACQTNEKKVENLIKRELFKTMHGYSNYFPIETIVTEAKQSAYTNKRVWEDTIFHSKHGWYDSLFETKKVLDVNSDHVVGCEVIYKNESGVSAIGNYRFVIDENFEKILIIDNLDDKELKKARELIQKILSSIKNRFGSIHNFV